MTIQVNYYVKELFPWKARDGRTRGASNRGGAKAMTQFQAKLLALLAVIGLAILFCNAAVRP